MRRGGVYSSGGPSRPVTTLSSQATAIQEVTAMAVARSFAVGPAIYGVGIDVLHISRMAEVYGRHPERLAQRLLHPLERAHLPQVRDVANYMAKCFAVKEAFVKALGTGFYGVAHDEIGWTRVSRDRPRLCVAPRLAAMLIDRGVGAMHLSLSDERDLVCALVTLERG